MRSPQNSRRRRSRRRRSRSGRSGRSRSGRSRVRSSTGSRVRSRARSRDGRRVTRQGSPVQREVRINPPIQPMMNLIDPSRSRSAKRLRQRDPSVFFVLRDLTEAMEQKEEKNEEKNEEKKEEKKEESDESVTPIDNRLTRTRSSTRARRLTY
jgi:hypothetical protein